jgi:hypothetical protein
MKALTVLQPWAQLLILGAKCYDVRCWQTTHRGPLLIHAGRTFPESARGLCRSEPIRDILARAGYKSPFDLPRRAFVGTITLEDCLPTDQLLHSQVGEHHFAFGDFQPGMWAWKMSNPRPLPHPIGFPGRLGVFEVPTPLGTAFDSRRRFVLDLDLAGSDT